LCLIRNNSDTYLINVQSYVKVWQSRLSPHCFKLRKCYNTMLEFTHYQFCFDKDHQLASIYIEQKKFKMAD
jgi:hypothetical protein